MRQSQLASSKYMYITNINYNFLYILSSCWSMHAAQAPCKDKENANVQRKRLEMPVIVMS